MTSLDLGPTLLTIARSAIAERLALPRFDVAHHEALQHPCASFVTLRKQGELRGCIGSIQAVRPLGVDVRENAIGAAFRDPRFAPLDATEFEEMSVEVSLLSIGQRLEIASEADLIALLRPGVDGLTLEHGRHRATFLPQVWKHLPEPRQFLAQLKRKAGLPPGFWNSALDVCRFQVTKWAEQDLLVEAAPS